MTLKEHFRQTLLVSRFAAVGPTAVDLDAVSKGGRTARRQLINGLLLIVDEELTELIIEDLLICLAI